MYFPHSADGASAVVRLDPDHQPVLGAPSHLVEELQTLELPLGVEDAGFEQGRLLRLSVHCAEVHEVPAIYKIRPNNTSASILLVSFVSSDLRRNSKLGLLKGMVCGSDLCIFPGECDPPHRLCSSYEPSLHHPRRPGSSRRCWRTQRHTGPAG